DPPAFASSVIDIYRESAWSVWIRESSQAFRVCVAWDSTSVPVYVFKFTAATPATQWLATYDAAVALMLQRIGSNCTTAAALFRMAMELGCPMLVLRDVAGLEGEEAKEEGKVGSGRGVTNLPASTPDSRPSPSVGPSALVVGDGEQEGEGSAMDGTPPSDASVASQDVSRQKSGGDGQKEEEPSSASPFGRATCPGLGWRPWNYKIDHIDVGEYLRQRRLHYTLERAAAVFKRGGILGRIPCPSKPLILCTFEDGTTVADEDITCEDLDILIGTYFVANNPVDRFNTKKVTFWPTELMFNSKGPYCGVWTHDAEEWYLQRRDVLYKDGQQGLTADQWR
ncbi:hypothetical protein EV121DRAFT_274892, partial [Schizophyllum commune]